MKKDTKIIESTIKLGIAVASIFYPVASLIEPAIVVISDILKDRQSLSKFERKMRKRLDADLNICINNTLKAMMNEASTDTARKAAHFLEPYIETKVSELGAKRITSKVFEQAISNGLKRKDVYAEMYLVGNDFKYLHDLFYEKFSVHVLKFPELSAYYNQQNIKANSDNINRLWKEIEALKKQHGDSTTREKLKDMLNLSFENERKHNPSVDNICFFEKLLPRGRVKRYLTTAIINKDKEGVSVCDFFKETWKDPNQNHISITGIGGIGKTVTLFSQCYPVPTIYIPLRELSVSPNDANQEYISKYIKEHTLNSFDNAFKVLLQLCNEPWKNGPQVILLLDGLNELTSAKLDSVIREIKTIWAKKAGVQIVLTSRYDINVKLQLKNVHQVSIEPLSTNIIREHLKKENVTVPIQSDKLWKIIDTPLMLLLYSRSESIKASYNSEFANWRSANNGGSIIWNFLQSELCKADFHSKLESIIAIHFVAPFICYKMMQNNLFSLSIDAFKAYISEALSFYNNLRINDALPNIIVRAIDENETATIDTLHFFNLLTKNFGVFKSRGDIIQLVHQHFRDCLAAIHILQVGENAVSIPDVWKNDFDLYVTQFICDLLITEKVEDNHVGTWNKIWGFGYQKGVGVEEYIKKMLSIYKNVYGNDISKIDFSNVDLRQVSLSTFRLTEKSNKHFVNSKLGHDTFWGNGHSDTVCSTSWSINGEYYISASHDCTIRIYSNKNSVTEILDGPHKHYIRCAKCSPTDKNVIASAGDDQQLICWTRTKTSSDSCQTRLTWVPRIIGECSNWIRSLQWDRTGQRILCGDGNGNLRMFSENNTIVFEHRHSKNVRYLSWLETESKTAIASGSDDGMFCIWRENGTCVYNKQLDSPITSINWIQSGMYLVTSTSRRVYFYKVDQLTKEDNTDIRLELVKQFIGEDISCITASNTDQLDHLAIFDNNNLKVLSLLTIEEQLQIDEIGNYRYDGETNKIITAEWNQSCSKLICGSRDGSVSCIDVLKDEENNQRIIFNVVGRRCCKAARCSSWSPNGQWLAIGYDDCSVRIWDPLRECCLAVLKGHTDSVKSLSWAPDSSSLVSGSDDNEVKIWEGPSITLLRPRKIFKHEESVNAVIWLKNNIIVSASDDGSLCFIHPYDLEKNNKITQHTQRGYALATSPNEDYLISGGNDNYILLWDLKTFKCHKFGCGHQLPIRAVAWSNNGRLIISSSNDCTIKLRYFDLEKGTVCDQITSLPQMHNDFMYGATISGNDLYVIGGSTDSTVGFWKTSTTEFIHNSTVHKGFVWNVSPSPEIDKKFYIATSSSDGTVKIWDVSISDLGIAEPCCSLPVIPEIDIVGCDFTGSIIEDESLKDLITANGGILN